MKDKPNQDQPDSLIKVRQEFVQKLYPQVEWESPTKGLIECPGVECHTSNSATPDCAIFIDKVPTVSCFHQSCAEAIVAANNQLRSEVRKAEADGRQQVARSALTPEQKAWLKKKRQVQALRKRALSSLPQILTENAWTPDQARRESPIDIPSNALEHLGVFLKLFNPADVIWLGNPYDSGTEHHRSHFQTAEFWKTVQQAP